MAASMLKFCRANRLLRYPDCKQNLQHLWKRNSQNISATYIVRWKHSSTKINDGEAANVEAEVGNRPLRLSTGKFARFADGCAVAEIGDTSVLVTAVSKTKPMNGAGFVPLTVDYRQKAAAVGRIPTNHLRRELGATDLEILTSRMIDRSIRPLFPKEYFYETQVVCNILAMDGQHDPAVASINGASAALAVSDIPWNGPIGAVRVGMIDEEVVINPTRQQLTESEINMVIAGGFRSSIMMIEASADNVLQSKFVKAIRSGVRETQKIIVSIEKLAKEHGKTKRILTNTFEPPKQLVDAVRSLTQEKYVLVYSDETHHKFSRDNASNQIRLDHIDEIKEMFPDVDLSLIHEAFRIVSKEVFRSLIFNNRRCDGRRLDQLRNISCSVDLFKPLHGSAMFQRGQTQVLCTVTFDSKESALRTDPISEITGMNTGRLSVIMGSRLTSLEGSRAAGETAFKRGAPGAHYN